jgi:ferrochelatase
MSDNQSSYQHGTTPAMGVLLANLGTPDAPTPSALRRYLGEFLWDRRVVDLARPLWWLILHGIILRIRPARSAKAYSKVWTDEGSPLLVISRRQGAALQRLLGHRLPGPVRVVVAMRYGNPSIRAGLEELRAAGVRRLIVLPLYPQYSAATTASTFDAVAKVLADWPWIPELRLISDYHSEAGYISALASSIREAWAAREAGDKLLFSFHGVPKRYLLNGDPYHCLCHATARQVAEALDLEEARWQLVFQSRFGREEWLRPYADETLEAMGRAGAGDIDVVCPGFSADCLETLEEIAMTNRDLYRASGGGELRYIPALNDRADHIEMLAELVCRHAAGWPEALAVSDPGVQTAARAQARARAIAMGAAG